MEQQGNPQYGGEGWLPDQAGASGYPQQGYPQQGYPPVGDPWSAGPPSPYPPPMSGPPYPPADPFSAPPYPGPPMADQPYSAPPGPVLSGPPYAAPPFAPPPPPRRGGGTGVVLGLVIGGLAVLVLCCGGGLVGYRLLADDSGSGSTAQAAAASGSASPAAGATPTRTWSPTPSPTPTVRDLATLDNVNTDSTPFELEQFFHRSSFTSAEGETFTRSAAGFYSACENSGGTKMKTLMRKNGCGNMAVGVYLNAAKDLMIGVMVMPLPAAANATSVFSAVKSDATLRGELWVWCPNAPEPGNKICAGQMNPNLFRYFTYTAYHRYALIASIVYTDGRTKGGVEATMHKAGIACLNEVGASIPRIY